MNFNNIQASIQSGKKEKGCTKMKITPNYRKSAFYPENKSNHHNPVVDEDLPESVQPDILNEKFLDNSVRLVFPSV